MTAPTQTLGEHREKAKGKAKARSNGHGDPAEAAARLAGEDGQTLADLGENAGEEEDGQLFVMENGVKIGLRDLIARNTPIFFEFKMDGKAMKGGQDMGLISFTEPDRVLVVPGRAGKIVTDPTYDGDGSIKHVTVRQHFKPSTVYDGRTEAARVALLGE
jgi:hypothetical protein